MERKVREDRLDPRDHKVSRDRRGSRVQTGRMVLLVLLVLMAWTGFLVLLVMLVNEVLRVRQDRQVQRELQARKARGEPPVRLVSKAYRENQAPRVIRDQPVHRDRQDRQRRD